MREAVIVAGVRTAVGKAPRGSLRTVRPDDMAAAVIEDLLRRVPALPPGSIDDVIMGCATPEGESGTNVARIAVHRPGNGDMVTVIVVEDNLVKGAAGQAVQNMNLMFGLPETAGLTAAPVLP